MGISEAEDGRPVEWGRVRDNDFKALWKNIHLLTDKSSLGNMQNK